MFALKAMKCDSSLKIEEKIEEIMFSSEKNKIKLIIINKF